MEEHDQSEVSEVLKEGDFFDDIHLVYDMPRRTSVRACKHVDVLKLSVADLKIVLMQFPQVESQIKRVGQELFGEYAANKNAHEHFPPRSTTV